MRGADLRRRSRARSATRRSSSPRRAGAAGTSTRAGEAVTLPTEAGERRIAPVERDGQPIAALVHDASLDDDPALVEAVRAAAAIALENDQLHAEADARLVELQASRERIVAAGDAERRRLERDLHDGAQQRLVALSMQLRFLQTRIRDDPSTAEELAGSASAELAESLEELRELARGIHPAVLDHGLETALESLASRSPVPTSLRYDATADLPRAVEIAAYFVVSRGADQRGEVRPRDRRDGPRVARPARHRRSRSPTTGSAVRRRARLRPARARRPRRGAGRPPARAEPARGGGTTVTAELPCAS